MSVRVQVPPGVLKNPDLTKGQDFYFIDNHEILRLYSIF